MKHRFSIVWCALLLLRCTTTPATTETTAEEQVEPTPEISLQQLWKQTQKSAIRVVPPQHRQEFVAVGLAAQNLLRAIHSVDKSKAKQKNIFARAKTLERFGYSLFRCRLETGEAVLALVDMRGGLGAYLLRLGPVSAEVIVQSPHRFFDLGTGPIGRRLFATTSLRGYFFNTAHRYSNNQGQPTTDASSDVAHKKNSHFSAFTAAAGSVLRNPVVIQLHGFAETEQLKSIDAIVSSGSAELGPHAQRVAAILHQLGAEVRRYPVEIQQLGGTENAQAEQLLKSATPFVHIEMSLKWRQHLQRGDTAQQLSTALVTAFSGEPR